jgi:hypothetical protein
MAAKRASQNANRMGFLTMHEKSPKLFRVDLYPACPPTTSRRYHTNRPLREYVRRSAMVHRHASAGRWLWAGDDKPTRNCWRQRAAGEINVVLVWRPDPGSVRHGPACDASGNGASRYWFRITDRSICRHMLIGRRLACRVYGIRTENPRGNGTSQAGFLTVRDGRT